MVKFCALLACKNRDLINPKTAGLRHHKFPAQDNVREQWIHFVNKYNRSPDLINGLTNKPRTGTMLCQEHFESELYLPSGRLSRTALPTKAPKFTMEIAYKNRLVPSMDSYDALDLLNDFEKDYLQAVEELLADAESVEPVAVDDDAMVKDRTLSNLFKFIEQPAENNGFERNLIDHILHVEINNKENNPLHPVPQLLNCDIASGVNQPLIRQGISFGSLSSMNTSGPPVFSTPKCPKRKLHIGDLSPSDFETREKAQKSLSLVKDQVRALRQELKNVKKRATRYELKMKNLESLLEEKRLLQPISSR